MSDYSAEREADEAAMRDREHDERCRYVLVDVHVVKMSGSMKAGPFTYACPFEDVRVGDTVVVPFGREGHLRLGEITEIDPPVTLKKYATKWVAAHVDHRAHDMCMAMGMPATD